MIDRPEGGRSRQREVAALNHASRLIHRICQIAGSATLIDDARASLEAEGVRAAIRNRDTAALFDWLMGMLSYQGISDRVAEDYIARHGQATWHAIETDLRHRPRCPKLKTYWHFHGCGYNKTRFTCSEPTHIEQCCLPRHWLRNGHLNQTARWPSMVVPATERIRSFRPQHVALPESTG
jgi:hypothetical protein